MHEDNYLSIKGTVEYEEKIQSSRFIGVASPVESTDMVDELIAKGRKEFHDATHNCFAYRIGHAGNEFRANDDGEPAGSAGKPILSAIDKFGLTNTLIVVTRYFGGTKLGVGGLVRAYGGVAQGVLERAEVIQQFLLERLRISFPYDYTGQVMHVLSTYGAKIGDTRYEDDVHLEIRVRQSLVEPLQADLAARTNGNVSAKKDARNPYD